MTFRIHGYQLAGAGIALALAAGAAGYGLAHLTPGTKPAVAQAQRKILYWYDPMAPDRHFDRPGKSPSMDMPLAPKYADEAADPGDMRIDPATSQNLGMRLATARVGTLEQRLIVPGVVDFDQRAVAVVQARAAGFVQRVYARAPGDVAPAGAPLADLLVPEWAGAQGEYLAVRKSGDARLTAAARQRLTLLGMSVGQIARMETSGRPQPVVTITAPIGGTIRTLGVRSGMAVTAGQTLAEINGLGQVWVTALVSQAQAGAMTSARAVEVTVDGFPGQVFPGRVVSVLPETESASRTVQVRIEVPNRDGLLRPGMFASVAMTAGKAKAAVLVPSEAVIRTGARTLIMIAKAGGRFEPREVITGREAGGRMEILNGVADGEQVVASGQFLLDSEARLTGVGPVSHVSAAAAGLYQSEGRIEALSDTSITVSHEPVAALGWPAMTMTFRLPDPSLSHGLEIGDRIRFRFDETGSQHTLRSVEKVDAPR